jgi:thiol:disulfide interchange protein DsbA
MRRLLAGFLLIGMLFPVLVQAELKQGQHYTPVPFPVAVETGNKIEVREIFWYGCPHCYVLEPGLTRWLKTLPANAQFVRTPGTLSPRWVGHAQAYYTFEALGVLDKLHAAFFKAVQAQHGGFSDEAAITDFAVSQGVDRKKFTDTFNSFGVRMLLDKAKQVNQDLNIDSVPTLVVDGKYITNAAMAGGEEAMFKVLDQLISKAAQERKKQAARH